MTTHAIHFAHSTLERAVETISEGTSFYTPEQLAGWYAYEASREAGFGYDDDTLEAHLDVIRDAGAVFDQAGAIAAARGFAEQFA